ncbi:hypothetical protein SO694_000114112 [Aureococcus anophagefferens]|uniref:C3H1-type domain-containing protein n=1 Tax=Aureococcus anophagefferens TaxID=44056 RepID=A0ABR1GEM8_AURAN
MGFVLSDSKPECDATEAPRLVLAKSSESQGLAPAKPSVLVGQVVHRRRLSKKLCFLDVVADGERYCLVAKSEVLGVATACGLAGVKKATDVRAGDVVRAAGVWEDAATLVVDGRLDVVDRWDTAARGPFAPVPPPPSGKALARVEVCKYWVNTGACSGGAACRYAHDGSARAAAANAWVASKRLERRRLRGQPDDLAAHDESSNASRHRIVAEFLLKHVGRDALAAAPVLDVAGGRGGLAFELQVIHGVETVLVEPRVYENRLTRRQHKILKKRGEGAARVPRHVAAAVGGDFDDGALVAGCSALVGLHADQATEWIVDEALRLDKPFLVVPCCVFPSLFAARIHPVTAAPVVSHQDFVEYLLAKRYASGGAVRHAILPFAGRNQCVWGVPEATPPE